MNRTRNSAKAIIIRDGHLLVTSNVDKDFVWYLLPGGGQQFGETLTEALQRECQEEIGVNVQVGDLQFVREYIGKNHEFADADGESHQVEFMFACEIDAGYEPRNGPAADTYQVEVVWLPLADARLGRLYPRALGALLAEEPATSRVVYIGDVN